MSAAFLRKLAIAVLTVGMAMPMMAQKKVKPKGPKNWFNLDPTVDNVYGVGTEEAYKLLKGRTSQTVIVAVIDGGTDVKHEDLKDVIWVNKGEIPGNKIDDDKNGYVDDIHGWNFIGGKNGENVSEDNLEATRVYRAHKAKFENADSTKLSGSELKDFRIWTAAKAKMEESKRYIPYAKFFGDVTELCEKAKVNGKVNKKKLNALYSAYQPEPDMQKLKEKMGTMMKVMKGDVFAEQMKGNYEQLNAMANFHGNPDFDPRKIVGDDYSNPNDRNYGNADVIGPDALHGTHVAGIIAASRKNGKGMDGVADNVKIMVVRCVPNGDERDKDVANSIRYAVDNGAKVINMSFGKAFSWDKGVVNEAVKYAASKDVLLVHAAGNDNKLNTGENVFPNAIMEDGSLAKNWIEVGASAWKLNDLTAEFSNYSEKYVDVFAPGVAIFATLPGSKYGDLQGTSMASPVTAGVAALLRSYFPQLTAEQTKDLIQKNVTPITTAVKKPGTSDETALSRLSKTGGVVNAKKAVEEALKLYK